jgi:hypothetical protein
MKMEEAATMFSGGPSVGRGWLGDVKNKWLDI